MCKTIFSPIVQRKRKRKTSLNFKQWQRASKKEILINSRKKALITKKIILKIRVKIQKSFFIFFVILKIVFFQEN